MRGFLLILFTFLIGINSTFAYDLVLPKEKKSVVTMNYAFFVGKANPNEVVSINDQKIYLASNGAFAHSVKLKDGENRILVKSNFSSEVYKIYKVNKKNAETPELIEFESKLFKSVVVIIV